MGDKFKVVLAKFSTLSLAVFIVVSVLRGILKRTHLELKFHPISSRLSEVGFALTAQWLHTSLVILWSRVQIMAERKVRKVCLWLEVLSLNLIFYVLKDEKILKVELFLLIL
jgi:hypothetical protein